jgi:hypothetical protein
MNPDQPSRDEIEAKLTALLLGELPADEAEAAALDDFAGRRAGEIARPKSVRTRFTRREGDRNCAAQGGDDARSRFFKTKRLVL